MMRRVTIGITAEGEEEWDELWRKAALLFGLFITLPAALADAALIQLIRVSHKYCKR